MSRLRRLCIRPDLESESTTLMDGRTALIGRFARVSDGIDTVAHGMAGDPHPLVTP